MNAVYIANFCNVNVFQDICEGGSECEDSVLDFEACASPQFASTTLELTDQWIEKVKKMAVDEYMEVLHEDTEPFPISWTASKMEYPKFGRPNMVLHGTADWGPGFGMKLTVIVVIQHVTLD